MAQQRGRKSSAELSIAPTLQGKQRPSAPTDLSGPERQHWETVINSSVGGYISPEALPLLKEYCRVAVECDVMAELLAITKPEDLVTDEGFKRWVMLRRERSTSVKDLAMLANRLRISPSSRVHDRVAGNAEKAHSVAKPWEG